MTNRITVSLKMSLIIRIKIKIFILFKTCENNIDKYHKKAADRKQEIVF